MFQHVCLIMCAVNRMCTNLESSVAVQCRLLTFAGVVSVVVGPDVNKEHGVWTGLGVGPRVLTVRHGQVTEPLAGVATATAAPGERQLTLGAAHTHTHVQRTPSVLKAVRPNNHCAYHKLAMHSKDVYCLCALCVRQLSRVLQVIKWDRGAYSWID